METNMTEGKEWKLILLFMLPMMGAGVLQFLYAAVDSVIIGNFIGSDALGAVGIPGPLIWLLNGINSGAGMGTSIVLAHFYGAGEKKRLRDGARTALLLYTLFGAVWTVLYLCLAKPVLWGFMNAPAEMRDMSYTYFSVYCLGIVPQLLYNVIYGILRAHGDSKSSLLFLAVAALLNTGLDLLFVVVFRMGVAGAAWATILAQAGSAAASFFYMWKKYGNLRLTRGDLRFDRNEVFQNLRMSLPIMLQSSVACLGFLFLQRLVNSFGSASIEGFAAVSKAEDIAWIPMTCFGGAVSAFTGQNMGAGRIDRVRSGFRSSLWLVLFFGVFLGTLLYLTKTPVLRLFNLSGDAMLRAREQLDLMAVFLFVMGFHNAASGLMQGVGQVRLPAFASIVNLGTRIGLAYWMAGTEIGFRSIYYSMPPAWILTAFLYMVGYRRLTRTHTVEKG
ncbi:MAG: MATE family efflux transporter [Lachnospiraceae bacterium]|nr:MATE family efflux transporter [Lachnospiraceae bacterium]